MQDGESVLPFGTPVRGGGQLFASGHALPATARHTPSATASSSATATVFGLVAAPTSQPGLDPFAPARPAARPLSSGYEPAPAAAPVSRIDDPFAGSRARPISGLAPGQGYGNAAGSYGNTSAPPASAAAPYAPAAAAVPPRPVSGGQPAPPNRHSASAPYSVAAVAAEHAKSLAGSPSQAGFDPAGPRASPRPYVDPSRSAAGSEVQRPSSQPAYQPASPLATRPQGGTGYQPASPLSPRPGSTPGFEVGQRGPLSSPNIDAGPLARPGSRPSMDYSAALRPPSQPGMDPAFGRGPASSPGMTPFAGQPRAPGHGGRDASGRPSGVFAPAAATPVHATDDDFVAVLQLLGIGAGLTPGEVHVLAQACMRQRLTSGEELFADASPATAAYLAADGILRQEFAMPEGNSRAVTALKVGEWCGEQALAGGPVHVGKVVAATDAAVFVFSVPSIANLAKVQPGLLVRMMAGALQHQAKRAKASQARVDHLVQQVFPRPQEPAPAQEGPAGGLGKLLSRLTGAKEEP